MTAHSFTAADWLLLRIAVVAIDVAAVVLIVWFVKALARWRRRMAETLYASMGRQKLAAATRVRSRIRYVAEDQLGRTKPSRATASHRVLH